MTLLAAVSLLLAQAAAAPSASPTPVAEATPVVRDYQVGSGDVVEVTVFGNDDLSRTTLVQPNGTITLPLLGEVPVAQLTVAEIKRKLTSLLARDYLVNPQVDVRIREYQSQFVWVVGEVNNPGRKPLRGRTRLIDLLVECGGFTTRASGEVTISRAEAPGQSGNSAFKVRLSGTALTPQEQVNLEIQLKTGDVITASARYYVTVEGEVIRPSRYPIESELTVTGAISLAGGLTRYGKGDVKVLRRVEGQANKTVVIKVDLGAIRKGKKPDLVLMPNDVITVPRKLF
jgi:polysaccharide biosynthesis/export protein